MGVPRALGGRTLVVTGAARGIGAGVARAVAARGARVALLGLEPAELARVAADCGPDALALEVDVTDRAGLDAAFARVVDRFGTVDAVVANAGISPVGLVRSIDPAAFERTVEVNLLGCWRTVRAALPHLMASGGYLLIVSSLSAVVHAPGMAAYTVSKAGAEALADALRFEMLPHRVAVGCAYFSWIDTDLVRGADATGLGGYLRGRLPGPMGRTHPVAAAVDAVVDGIARRRSVVTAPRWVRALLLGRRLVNLVAVPAVRRMMPEADRIADAETLRLGAADASLPVGAGGAADARLTARTGRR